MKENDTTSPPVVPSDSTFRRLQQRRGIIARLDNVLLAYWESLLADSPSADVALEGALERYAKDGPPINDAGHLKVHHALQGDG
jgi:hypothetical protein